MKNNVTLQPYLEEVGLLYLRTPCLPSLVAIPVYVKQSISFFESGSGGRMDLTVGPKQTMGKTVEGFVVTIHMPKAVLSASLVATQGSYTYDPATKVTTCHETNKLILDSKLVIDSRFQFKGGLILASTPVRSVAKKSG